ncbi:hypothetical protein ACOMHN_036308 [Nucella lapillus]
MAAEVGGSKPDSPENDDPFGGIAAEQTVENGIEITEDNLGMKHTSRNASTSVNSSNGDPEESESRAAVLSGWLNKCGNIGFVKTAKPLWFVFSDDTCKLYYYRHPQDLLPLGEIDIKHASFYFDANNQKPGLFEIRSDGKVYVLDAQGQHRMAFWLEELQKKRRHYTAHRNTISSDKMAWTLKQNHRRGSGLTGHGKGDPEDGAVQRSASLDNLDESDSPPSGLPNLSRLSKAGRWSLSNLQSEIREAVSSKWAQISPTNKLSPIPSPSSEGKEDWTFVDDDADHPSHTDPSSLPPRAVHPLPPSNPAAPPPPPANSSGSKLGGKFAKMFKASKRSQSQSEAGSSSSSSSSPFGLFKDSGSKKAPVYQPDSQTCFKCRALQGDLISLREDLKASEEETQANREIIKLMQKELDVLRVTMDTRKESEGKGEEEKDAMLQHRDKHVVELEHSLAFVQEKKAYLEQQANLASVQEKKAYLEQQAKINESSQKSLQDEVSMLQEMLMARDEAVVTLTRQISELENKADSPAGGDGSSTTTTATTTPLPPPSPMVMPDTREMQALKDSVQAYQMQNNFLTKEIMELNELRNMDEKREKELLIKYAKSDAMYCQTRSKFLVLLTEKQQPVRGGEEAQSQEAVSQLLKEALETETDSGAAALDPDEARYPFLASHSTVYDTYGFLIGADDDLDSEDPLLTKASLLQRQCDEINTRMKDVDATTSQRVKWENFMVGQSQMGKPLARSPELKALVRLGVPHVYKEHIWKGSGCSLLTLGAQPVRSLWALSLSWKGSGCSLLTLGAQPVLERVRMLTAHFGRSACPGKGQDAHCSLWALSLSWKGSGCSLLTLGAQPVLERVRMLTAHFGRSACPGKGQDAHCSLWALSLSWKGSGCSLLTLGAQPVLERVRMLTAHFGRSACPGKFQDAHCSLWALSLFWKGCINFYVGQTRDKLGPLYYKKDLGERIKNSKSNPAVKQIELDLLRTLPSNRHFDSIDSDGIPKLRRVLLSYSVHNPLIGYCQGLNRLAAIALLFLSEEESFWCLEALIEHILPKEYYTKTLAAAQADQRVLKELVGEKLPKLQAHFDHYDVDLSLYTFNWFLTIFVDNVRPETFLRCWDALLYEGSKVLFRFALGFLKYSEEEILKRKEAPQIYRYMRSLGEKITSGKEIAQIAFDDLNPFPMRAISSKRVHHMQMVLEELRELDLIRQDFQSSHSPCGQEGYISEDDLDLEEPIEEEEEEEDQGLAAAAAAEGTS